MHEIVRSIAELLSVKCPSLNLVQYKKETWDDAFKIKGGTCISAPDVIHLACVSVSAGEMILGT